MSDSRGSTLECQEKHIVAQFSTHTVCVCVCF